MIDDISGAWGLIQFGVQAALVLWAVAGTVYAVLAPASAYEIEGKWSKPAWVGICAAAAVLFTAGLLGYVRTFGFLGLIAMVALGVFFADVRPAVGGRRR